MPEVSACCERDFLFDGQLLEKGVDVQWFLWRQDARVTHLDFRVGLGKALERTRDRQKLYARWREDAEEEVYLVLLYYIYLHDHSSVSRT